jgi:GTP-binding protein
MRFVDRVVIEVEAGKGGAGCVSFRREPYVPQGGPNGGDGGRGGDVVFEADANRATLLDFRYRRIYKAKAGRPGEGSNRTGADGEDAVVPVPQGTLVYDDGSGELLADLVDPGQRFVAAHGGKGGRGNYRFRSPTNQAPRRADAGQGGEARRLRLELKLLADVGLVGFPNAGKSTLLSRLTSARPKIADYPFTTLVPNLGIVDLGDYESCTIADIPGLIEGASEGKGLGHEFLRHVERTRLLVFLLDVTDEPQERYRTLRREVQAHAEWLAETPHLVCLSKCDLWPSGEPWPDIEGETPLVISAVTGQGLDTLRHALRKAHAS